MCLIHLSKEIASFESCCHIVDIIVQAKRGVINTLNAGALLKEAVPEWYRLHKDAYGHTCLKPKSHWMMDVAEQMENCEVVLDTFIIERLHLRAKRISELVKVIWAFEKATMAGLVNEQFEDPLRERRPFFDGLTGHRTFDYDGIKVGDDMQVGALHFSAGDVVFMGAQEAGEWCSAVSKTMHIFSLSRSSSSWSRSAGAEGMERGAPAPPSFPPAPHGSAGVAIWVSMELQRQAPRVASGSLRRGGRFFWKGCQFRICPPPFNRPGKGGRYI